MSKWGSKLALGAAACMVVVGLAFAPAAKAAPRDDPQTVADGLRFETHATFALDEAAKAVHVRDDMTVTNTQPAFAGGYFYFPRLVLPVGAEAINLAATRDDGTALNVSTDSTTVPWLAIATIDLQPALLSGETQTIAFTYDLPGQPARSPDTTRVNDAAAAFEIYALGDPGITSVKVVVPKGLDIEIAGETMDKADQPDGTVVYTADSIADPALWGAGVNATDRSKLLTSDPKLADHDIQVRGWPDDQAWVDFVDGELLKGLPSLESMIGLPWPKKSTPLQVIETVSPYLYGYAGWYTPSENEIDVGDELDPVVILHEVSHVWFNHEVFSARWLDEGLAQEYSNLAIGQLNGAPAAEPNPIDQVDPVAFQLNTWDSPHFTTDDGLREQFGYNASWTVVHTFVSEVGVQKMAAVYAAAANHEIAYVGAGAPEHVGAGAIDWQGFLDLVEERTGSTTIEPALSAYVLDDGGRAKLPLRTATRAAYAAFVAGSGGWGAPFAVRKAMADWDFDRATSKMTTAQAVLTERDQIAATLAPIGLQVPAALQQSYETGTDLDAIKAEADADLQAAKDLAAAVVDRHASHGPLAQIGLLGGGADRVYASAKAALVRGDGSAASKAARRASSLEHDATRDGIVRLFALLLLVVVAVRLRRTWNGRLRPT